MATNLQVAICVTVVVSLFSAVLSVKPPHADCGTVKSKVSNVDISVNCDARQCSLVKGKNVTFTVEFTPNEEVTKSKTKVVGVIEGVNIAFKESDGCTDTGLQCPLKSGVSVKYTSTIFVKTIYPNIRLVVKWSLLDQSNAVVWCEAIPVAIVSG